MPKAYERGTCRPASIPILECTSLHDEEDPALTERRRETPTGAEGESPVGTGLEGLRFEEAMERLEAIVSRLEHGELGLEESLALYEEGVGLARRAQAQLEAVEGKITALLADGRVEELSGTDRPAALDGNP